MQTEFEFTLPKGFLDSDRNIHRKGLMRLAIAMDEIVPLQDARVKSNPAYATVLILSRVITRLGAIEDISPRIVECFFACDLSYLQKFYREINELDTPEPEASGESRERNAQPEDLLEATSEPDPSESLIPEGVHNIAMPTEPLGAMPQRQSSPALL